MSELNKELINLIRSKSILNKDVTDITFEAFSLLKHLLLKIEKSLKSHITDNRVKIHFKDNSTFEAELKVGDDILIFLMYTNALTFDASNMLYRSGYVQKDHERATCGMISIYNFLSDSFKYERRNDVGFLIGRMFINKEKHFFVEGKKQLGLLFNDFANSTVNEESVLSVIEHSIKYSIDIDLTVPDFDKMKIISVHDVLDYSLQATVASGKRLGFQFEENKQLPEI